MSFAPPRHVGVIMDGNGRWAAKRGLPRVAGHAAGEKAVLDVLEGALEAGIEWFTLFLFSTENWQRSAEEVSFLMKFCDDLLARRGHELVERGARLHVAGDLSDPRIPDTVRRRISETLSLTAHNTRLNLVIAFNYGSRREIADAARALAADAAAGRIQPGEVDEIRPGGPAGRAGDARRRPDHPHVRGEPAVQLPPVAGGLRRVVLHRGAMA